ncbi:signal transduction histidine kinase [Leifsonia sp. AK011]|uniref:sensor histidine kinase n=1 Tax=Leifsonia sp. AK011 TaxID=2723075 RepID=UPI0015C928EC|nr:HAMP domain-containing sensor histidine kinase [Leifsonia sp. AK011]NYF11428.1 signal transduction histidine kinase [Leifsonia sp. AK011]
MLSLADIGIIAGIALLCSLVVAMLAIVVLRLVRRASMYVHLSVIVAAAILSVTLGMIATAQYMYVSEHDLVVTFAVAASSAVVTLGLAVVLGRAFARRSERVRMLAAALGQGQRISPDVTERESSELAALSAELAATGERLALAREQVEAAEASRRELVAWISHDLRTPLAGLRAMAEALEDDLADDPVRFHRQIRVQVDRLSAMVDDLFELSKITSGTLTLNRGPVSLYDLASDAVAELAPIAAARQVELVAPERGDFLVMGDPQELTRVVGNLLMNAIQHSPPSSRILVTTRHGEEDDVVLAVEDAGGGIAEADLSKVFQAGWRATTSRTPSELWGRSAGAGLGLAIVQGIVEAHDGAITVCNVPGGCRFDVRLPRHDAVAA